MQNMYLLQLGNNKPKQPYEKWVKHLNRHFFKEDIQMTDKHVKRCLTSLITKESQIETIIGGQFIEVRVATIKQSSRK